VQLWRGPACGCRLLYAVQVDLTDAIAEELGRPVAALSLEMVYRSLYFFTQAYHRGDAADPVAYLAAKATSLGILKRQRQHALSPFADLRLTFVAGP
jgi:L-alanine-DL-glutamate epimerase-like enolase superfamily enzyme